MVKESTESFFFFLFLLNQGKNHIKFTVCLKDFWSNSTLPVFSNSFTNAFQFMAFVKVSTNQIS